MMFNLLYEYLYKIFIATLIACCVKYELYEVAVGFAVFFLLDEIAGIKETKV